MLNSRDQLNDTSCSTDRTATINSLPDEILLTILEAHRHQSVHDFARSLQTCVQWYTLGRSLLWKDIVLDHHDADKLLRCIISPTTVSTAGLAMRTRSLTISIRPCTSPAAQWLNCGTKTLAKILPYLSSLISFSLTQTTHSTNPWDTFQVDTDTIADILRSLPISVRNLDLDIAPLPGQGKFNHSEPG